MGYTKENLAEWLNQELADLINDVRQIDKSDMPIFNKGLEVKCAVDAKIAKILKKMPAPDLYEALKAFDKYLEMTYPENMKQKWHATTLMEKAIAKVEGLDN